MAQEQRVNVSYGGSTLAQLTSGQTAILRCQDRRMTADVVVTANILDSPLPIQVSTEAEMAAILESTTVAGGIYQYVGDSTDTFENGGLYMVTAEGE